MPNTTRKSAAWLLIADGEPLSKNKLITLAQGRRIMVLDGAYAYVESLGLPVDILLGDFDSIDPALLEVAHKADVLVVPAPNQNFTDLEKGLIYLDQLMAQDILICAATGRRLQHTLYNLRLLKRFHRHDRPLKLLSETETICYVEDDSIQLTGQIRDSVGILGFPQAVITTTGLQYDVTDYSLQFEQCASVSNALTQQQAHIIVQGAALIIVENASTA